MPGVCLVGLFHRRTRRPTAMSTMAWYKCMLNHCLSWSKFVNTHFTTPDSGSTYTCTTYVLGNGSSLIL